MVAHCLVSGAETSSGQILPGQEIVIGKQDLALAEADYYALGHVHMPQELGPHMYYAGSTYHVNFGETEKKSFNLLELGKGRVEVSMIEIPSRRMALHEMRYDAATGTFSGESEDGDWVDAELRVRLYVTKEQASLVSDEDIRKRYPGAYSYKIEHLVIPEERVRTEMITKARSLREKITEWARVIEKQVPPSVLLLADELEQAVQ
jgi:exonuclease SbcD